MRLPRRTFLGLAAGTIALPAASRMAGAQAYPARPVRLVVGYPAGGSADITARLIAQWLSERFSQQVIVENRPGAGSNLAAEAIVKATPDGYILFLATAANAVSAALFTNLSFNFLRDLAPVAGIIRIPNVMTVNLAVSANTVPEFIAYAKANPGKVNMASTGVGSSPHMSGELFKMLTGVTMTHVPYRGDAPALVDLLGGKVEVFFGNIPASIQHIRSGALRALAVTTATRAQALPNVPTMNESVPGYEASAFFGICAPAATPGEIVAKLNAEINAGLADSTIKARLNDMGGTVIAGLAADFGKLIADEIEKWTRVIRTGNIKPE